MTDIDKNINGPAQQVEVPIVKVTDTAGDAVKTADELSKDAARQAFAATEAARKADASVSAADGSTSSVAGS